MPSPFYSLKYVWHAPSPPNLKSALLFTLFARLFVEVANSFETYLIKAEDPNILTGSLGCATEKQLLFGKAGCVRSSTWPNKVAKGSLEAKHNHCMLMIGASV